MLHHRCRLVLYLLEEWKSLREHPTEDVEWGCWLTCRGTPDFSLEHRADKYVILVHDGSVDFEWYRPHPRTHVEAYVRDVCRQLLSGCTDPLV